MNAPFPQGESWPSSAGFACFRSTVVSAAAGIGLMLAVSGVASAQQFVSLGGASNYAVLGGNINLHNVTVNGDGGVTSNGFISVGGPSTLDGDLYMGAGATLSQSGGITGSVIQPFDVNSALADAMAAAQIASTLSPDVVLSSVNGPLIIQSTGLQTVVNITGSVNLGGSNSLFLKGGPNDKFVINIFGGLDMNGSAQIAGLLGSGVDPSDVLVNVVGTGSKITTKVDNLIGGTVLAPYRQYELHSVNGAVIGGNLEMKLMSGSTVDHTPFIPVPEPGSAMLAALALTGGVFLRRRCPTRSVPDAAA